jgi:V8-like Glu-specific endopeptidase
VSSLPTEKSYDILTGLETLLPDDSLVSGASGGPVYDEKGNVVGLSYSALNEKYYNGAVDLQAYRVVISEKEADVLQARNGGVMKTSLIKQAIAALTPGYRGPLK